MTHFKVVTSVLSSLCYHYKEQVYRLYNFRIFKCKSISSVVKHIAIDSGGLGFGSRAGQIGHSIANGSPLLRRFFGAVLPKR